MCVPTRPKSFRPVMQNTHIFLFGLSNINWNTYQTLHLWEDTDNFWIIKFVVWQVNHTKFLTVK